MLPSKYIGQEHRYRAYKAAKREQAAGHIQRWFRGSFERRVKATSWFYPEQRVLPPKGKHKFKHKPRPANAPPPKW